MKDKPLISIVVPAYNVERYIDKCIGSVLAQTYSNWELLLIVGGQDRTVTICDSYALKDRRIKSIHDNKGLVPARNTGYRNATGDWITYLDGDDWIDRNMCEQLTEEISKNPGVDVIFSNDDSLDLAIIIADVNHAPLYKTYPFLFDKPHILDEILTIGYPPIPSLLKTEVAEKANISANIKASIGQNVSDGKQYLIGKDCFLISARVKGDNSGSSCH
jgi:glycosyltransferase involved in cell wall biosynthesis